MPRYYFHLTDGAHVLRDWEGIAFGTHTDVRNETLRAVLELAAEGSHPEWESWTLEVVDQSGGLVLRLALTGFDEKPLIN